MIKKISTTDAPVAIGPYSQAIDIGEFVFCSGQIPLVPETGLMVEGGIEEQARQMFANIKAVLAEAGLGFENIIKRLISLAQMGIIYTNCGSAINLYGTG